MTDNTYHHHTLNNGLTLLTIPMASVKSVTGLLLVGAGSRHEQKRRGGLSHFLEHMAFKGTKKRPTAREIAEEIDAVGAANNAFTSKEYTGYYIKAAAEHLGLVIDILSDMVLNSLYATAEIEREKGVIVEEINMRDDIPMWKVEENFERLLYGDSALGRRIIGEKENVRAFAREDFVDYVGRFYRPGNAVFAVAGGVGEKEVEELVRKGFGGWRGGKIREIGEIGEDQGEPAVSVEKKETEQAHLVLGVRAYPRVHPRRYALGLLTALLGGGMSSRLFHEVRERRGLAYYVRASTQRYRDVGYLAASAGVDRGKIEEAIRVVLGEFAKMREKGVGEKELQKAKEYVKGHLILSLEDSHEVADLYAGSWLFERKLRTPDEILAKIDAVTAEEVQSVAQDIFVESKLNLAVIGGFRDEQRLGKLLSL